ncbi:MAG: hypothetical protein ACOYO1_02390 [Bacteroidales bacterium]
MDALKYINDNKLRKSVTSNSSYVPPPPAPYIPSEKRVIDLNVEELQRIIIETTQAVIQAENSNVKTAEIKNRVFTINELAGLNLLGKYHKIKSLIKTGQLHQTADGKITGESVYNYTNR